MSGRPVVLENLAHQVLAYDAAGTDVHDLLTGWEQRSRGAVRITGRAGARRATGWLVTDRRRPRAGLGPAGAGLRRRRLRRATRCCSSAAASTLALSPARRARPREPRAADPPHAADRTCWRTAGPDGRGRRCGPRPSAYRSRDGAGRRGAPAVDRGAGRPCSWCRQRLRDLTETRRERRPGRTAPRAGRGHRRQQRRRPAVAAARATRPGPGAALDRAVAAGARAGRWPSSEELVMAVGSSRSPAPRDARRSFLEACRSRRRRPGRRERPTSTGCRTSGCAGCCHLLRDDARLQTFVERESGAAGLRRGSPRGASWSACCAPTSRRAGTSRRPRTRRTCPGRRSTSGSRRHRAGARRGPRRRRDLPVAARRAARARRAAPAPLLTTSLSRGRPSRA